MKKKKITKKLLLKREERRIKREEKEKLKLWKEELKIRACFKCEICKKTFKSSSLHAHHILSNTYKYKELRFDIRNGVVLCPYHHKFGPDSAHTNSLYLSWWLQKHKFLDYCYLIEKLEELEDER